MASFDHRTASGLPAAWLGTVCVALPFLIASNLSPSSTYFNQVWAVAAAGFWLCLWWGRSMLLGGPFPIGTSTKVALAACAVLALAMCVPGAPLGQRLLPLLCLLTAMLLLHGSAAAAARDDLESFIEPLMWGLLIGAAASLIVGLVQVFAAPWADGFWVAYPTIAGRAIGNMRQPNQLSTLLVWGLAAAVWLGLRREWPRALLAAVLAALVFGIALTASRTGTVGIALMVLWGLVDRRLPGWMRLLLLGTLPLYALSWWGLESWLSAHGVAYYGEDQIKKTLHGDPSSSRGKIWANAWAMILAQPWFGTGVGAFNFVWSMTPFPQRPVAFFDHTHNIALQLAAEYGLPLAALILLALLAAVGLSFRGWVSPVDRQAWTARSLLFMLVAAGLHSLLEYPLWYTYFLLPTAVMLGGLCGLAEAARRNEAFGGGIDSGWGTRLSRLAWAAGGALTLAGSFWATVQYWQVAVIFEPDHSWGEPLPLADRIARGQRSLLFGHHADYAAVTMAAHPGELMAQFERPLYHLADTRLLMAYAKALAERGDLERARHVAARLREFRNPASDAFFGPCSAASTASSTGTGDASSTALPFQCESDPGLEAKRLRPVP
jgi:O-antigen ligase